MEHPQSDPTEISRRHSPDMVNMISDYGGNPVKRFGYRNVGNAYLGFASLGGSSWSVKKIEEKLYLFPITISPTGEII